MVHTPTETAAVRRVGARDLQARAAHVGRVPHKH
jgi:hypothetical protein